MLERPSYIPPFQGCVYFLSVTQGVALGWYIPPLRGFRERM
jgi:hypothetical protein